MNLTLAIFLAALAEPQSSTVSLWPDTTTPVNPDSGDPASVELGVKFRSDIGGSLLGIRFYKSAANAGTHIGNVWTSAGTNLATVTFTGESVSGWQSMNFANPVPITAHTVYVASYFCPAGHYAGDNGYFSAGYDHPPLHALQDGAQGGNGVYVYGGTSAFPTQTYQASNYWVDVIFSPSPNIGATPSSLQVVENGGTATFTVSLLVNPTAQVVVQISSGNSASLLLTAPGGSPQGTVQLTFQPQGALSQEVTVTGVERHMDGSPVMVAITFDSVTSMDSADYPPDLRPSPISCTIIEDSPGIIVNPPSGLSTTNGGPQITFTIELATIPNGSVSLKLSLSDPDLATVSPTTLSNAAYNTPVTVTVTPLNANPQTTYIGPYDILIDPSQSADPAYARLHAVSVPIDTPVSLPPLKKAWGGCGLLGLELIVPLVLLGGLRRRIRSAAGMN